MKYTIEIKVDEDVANELKKHDFYDNPYSSFELNVISFSVMEKFKEAFEKFTELVDSYIKKRDKKGE